MPKADTEVTIHADHRERACRVPHFLSEIQGVSVLWDTLAHGDYSVPGKLVIERKSAADFTASIIDRRLFVQVERASEAGVPHIVLLEGDPYGVGRLSAPAITGAISWLMVVRGISAVSSPSQAMTAQLVHTMARHAIHGLGYDVNLHPPKPKSEADQAAYLVQSLPGVGPSTAAALLEAFGSAGAVMAATAERLVQVNGVGKAMANKIRAALDTKC